MKHLVIAGFFALAACQSQTGQSQTNMSTPKTIFTAPASDDAASLDLTKLPSGFPIISELGVEAAPMGCALSKANRFDAKPGVSYDLRYVLTALGDGTEGGLYQIAVNGSARTLQQTNATDMTNKKIRYFKTVEGPEVEIQLTLESLTDGTEKGTIGRIKAWDGDLPLMCGYNRIEVVGNCDL